ncbi:MAG: hypothetical protein J6Y52_01515 [Bacteroidales bacterium]|nr:hypothetical protein [Bacteroidales bacterium]
MKHLTTLALLATALLLTACASDEERIEKAAYKYSYAMANYDVDGAEKYATPETRETTLITARGLLTMVDTNYIKSDTPATIEITNIQIIDDTSAVATYHKTTPIKDFSATLEVRKRHGRWLAHSPIPVIEAPEPQMPEAK